MLDRAIIQSGLGAEFFVAAYVLFVAPKKNYVLNYPLLSCSTGTHVVQWAKAGEK